jgi:hypothetical protein
LREATSVNKGWVVVGLILLVSGLAGFQAINSSAYAQLLENGTVDSSQVDSLPSNLLQNQLSPDQNSLIATPGPTSDELSPPQQEPSAIGGDEGVQQITPPNLESSPETTADEQDTSETIGNSIVQNPVPGSDQLQSSQPGVSEQNNQPRTDDDDNDNSAREGQRGNQEAEEANDGGDGDDEDDEDDEEDEEAVTDSSREEIPSSLRNWLPFP